MLNQRGVSSNLLAAAGMNLPVAYNNIECSAFPRDRRSECWETRVRDDYGVAFKSKGPMKSGYMRSRALGRCSIHAISVPMAHRAARIEEDETVIFANIQINNEGARFCGRREFALKPGGLALYACSDLYHLDFDGASDFLTIGVPAGELARQMPNLAAHLEGPLDYDPALIKLLATTTAGLISVNRSQNQIVNDALDTALMNMLVAALKSGENQQAIQGGFGAHATLQRIRAHVCETLDDPDLTPAKVADTMGITVGYLHKIFLASGTTLMKYVLSERLERCRTDIAQLEKSRSLSQIAYSWGFNDASHFSRSFRNRFGVSPTEYRRQMQNREANFLES